MKQLKNLKIGQILDRYELPHRLIVYFASQCAKDVSHTSNPDPRSVAAVDMAERYGNGEEIPLEEVRRVADAAAYPFTASITGDSYSYSAHYAVTAVFKDSHYYSAHYAACAAAHATRGTNRDYKELLLTLINERLSEVEKLLIFS